MFYRLCPKLRTPTAKNYIILEGRHNSLPCSCEASSIQCSFSVDNCCNVTLLLSTDGRSKKRDSVGKIYNFVDVCTFTETASISPSHVAEDRIGVLLLNLGGPDTLNDVQPFLYNLFADPVCHKLLLSRRHMCIPIHSFDNFGIILMSSF